MIDDLTIRIKIIDAAKRLYQKNMLAGADGNISYKISDNHILITPAGVSKAFIAPEEIAVITLNNQIISGNPSSEKLMHLGVYKKCPLANCVVHAHPPTAIAWSIAKPDLRQLGTIPIAPYAKPGTQKMSDKIIPFLPKHSVILLANHGGLTWSDSLEGGVNRMECLEQTAEILFKASLLGDLTH